MSFLPEGERLGFELLKKGKGNLSLRFVRGPKIEVQFNTKISYILKNVLN